MSHVSMGLDMYDVMVKMWTPDGSAHNDVAEAILVGKGGYNDIMVGRFDEVVVVCNPNIEFSIHDIEKDMVNQESVNINTTLFDTTPMVLYANVYDEEYLAKNAYEAQVNNTLLKEDYFNPKKIPLCAHMRDTVIGDNNYLDRFKVFSLANKLRQLYLEAMGKPITGTPWRLSYANGFPEVVKEEGNEGAKHSNDTNHVSRNDSKRPAEPSESN